MLTHDNWNELNNQPWFRSVNHRLRLTANHRFSQKLKTINFLQQVPDSSLNVLGGLFRLRTHKAGTTILAEGDAVRNFSLLLDDIISRFDL